MLSFLTKLFLVYSGIAWANGQSVDCCYCQDRYTQESRITWYSGDQTCQNQPSPQLSCKLLKIAGKSCQSVRWVRRDGSLVCELVHLQYLDKKQKPHSLELSDPSCQAASLLGVGRTRGLAAARDGKRPMCHCDRDEIDSSLCALYAEVPGKPEVVDRKAPPSGKTCDSETCVALFFSSGAREDCGGYVPPGGGQNTGQK